MTTPDDGPLPDDWKLTDHEIGYASVDAEKAGDKLRVYVDAAARKAAAEALSWAYGQAIEAVTSGKSLALLGMELRAKMWRLRNGK